MISVLEKVKSCCDITIATMDGAYGWLNEVIAILVLVLITNLFAKWLLNRLHLHFEKQGKIWKDSFVKALHKPLSIYVWFFALIHALDLINHRLFEESPFTNMHMLMTLAAILCFVWFLMRWKRNVVNYMLQKCVRHEIAMERGKVDIIDKLLTMIIIFITLMVILEVTGQSMNTLIAFGGVGGLAIAFASQEIIASFFGGLMIYLTHPFTVGDWINLPERNIEGYVEDIGWYMTRIRTFEKRPIYVPNSTFSRIVVMNPSRMSHRQFKEIIGLRYADLPVLKKVIAEIKTMLQHHPDIDQGVYIVVALSSFGTYSIDIQVTCYTLTTETTAYAEVRQKILFEILDIIQNNGAELAFPTSDVYLHQS